ncbi:MAG: PQQ-binding-like beta-propeller repeat protein [Phycisphaeraceae bacterium]|nr:PQQ-binding-like beta-propeller repeat protein [Phycisphaeraceae bacterium]
MRRHSLCFITSVFIAGLLTLTATAQDWPQYRGPGSLGIGQATHLPTTWSDTENVAWKIPLPGAGSSSPIVLNGKLYLTCYSGYGVEGSKGTLEDLMLHLVCVEVSTGNILWNTPVKPALPEQKSVKDHGYTAQTPATDGRHIYVFFGKTGVFKFDLQGKQIWQTSVGTKTHGWGSGTSPVLYKNLVIVNASVESKSLVALDKQSGDEVWRSGGMESSWNTPHLVKTKAGDTELVVTVEKFVLGFDPATGAELWRCDAISDYICPSIVSQDGILYAIGGRKSQALAIRSGGRGDVTNTHKLWHAQVGANVCSPLIHDGHLYWVSDRNKTAYCLSLADGSIKFQEKVSQQPYASIMMADNKFYVVTRYGGTLVLAAKPQYQQLAHNRLSDKSVFNASPIVTNNRLILRSDRNLYCFMSAR